MRILIYEWVTGGGLSGLPMPAGWVKEGRAIRSAAAADFHAAPGIEVVVTLDARFASETGPWETVLIAGGREEPTLSRLASECDRTLLIAPETAGTLASLSDLVAEVGGRTMGSTTEAIAMAADKHRLAVVLQRRGVPTLPVEWYDRANPRAPSFGFPAVVKPVDGAGTLDTFLLESLDDHPSTTAWVGDLVIQPYQKGTPMSASYLVGADEVVHLLGVGWQDVTLEDNRFAYHGGRLPAPPALGQGAPLAAIRAVTGLRGFVGVDFLLCDDGLTLVLEVNPRLTTSFIGLRQLYPAGAMARAWLDALGGGLGGDHELRMIEPPPQPGSVQFRADGTIKDDGAARANLLD